MDKRTTWAIVVLVGGYIFCQVLADIAATKLVAIGSVVLPAGTFVFAATFTLRDLLHKRLGKEWARACIWTAAGLNLLMALYLQGMAAVPAPQFYPFAEEWSAIFGFVPAVVLASIAAELVSELIDTEVYHWWWQRQAGAPQWSRVLVSNAVSLPIDSLVFAGLGFLLLPPLFGAEALPPAAIPAIVGGQVLWKGVITLLSMPAIYLVKEEPLALEPAAGR
jgi:uncharacterized integral membrane protein (TIGR00697 family)